MLRVPHTLDLGKEVGETGPLRHGVDKICARERMRLGDVLLDVVGKLVKELGIDRDVLAVSRGVRTPST